MKIHAYIHQPNKSTDNNSEIPPMANVGHIQWTCMIGLKTNSKYTYSRV